MTPDQIAQLEALVKDAAEVVAWIPTNDATSRHKTMGVALDVPALAQLLAAWREQRNALTFIAHECDLDDGKRMKDAAWAALAKPSAEDVV